MIVGAIFLDANVVIEVISLAIEVGDYDLELSDGPTALLYLKSK